MHWIYILFICFACLWFILVLYSGQKDHSTAMFVQESLQQLNCFLLVSHHKNMQTIILATSQYKTNSSSCQVCPIPTDSAAWNLREQTKIYFAAQKVSQLKQTERGLFWTTDRLSETLRVPLCHPAHVLEVAFPGVWQWLSGWAVIFCTVIRLNGKLWSSSCDPQSTKPAVQQFFLYLIAVPTHAGQTDGQRFSGVTFRFLK